MTRIALLLVVEAAALAAMLALRIEVPWTDPGALAAMPEEALAAGIVRSAAIAIVGWLFMSTLLYWAAAPIPRLQGAVAHVTVPLVRRVVDTALAATLSLSVAAPALGAEAPPEPIVVTVDEGSSGAVIIPPGMGVAPPTLPSSPERAAEPMTPPTPLTSGGVAEPAPTEAAMVSMSTTSGVNVASTYEVRPGDHLWSIAEDVLTQRTGRAIVPDHEIAPFWRTLIEANRDSLRSGNPDLIYPGEVLTIPEASP